MTGGDGGDRGDRGEEATCPHCCPRTSVAAPAGSCESCHRRCSWAQVMAGTTTWGTGGRWGGVGGTQGWPRCHPVSPGVTWGGTSPVSAERWRRRRRGGRRRQGVRLWELWGQNGDMGTEWGHGDRMGTEWGQNGDSVGTEWGQNGDRVGTGWGRGGQNGDRRGTGDIGDRR